MQDRSLRSGIILPLLQFCPIGATFYSKENLLVNYGLIVLPQIYPIPLRVGVQ